MPAQVSVRQSGPASCAKTSWVTVPKATGLKIRLIIEFKNTTEQPLVVGRVEIVEERYYHKDQQGELHLFRTGVRPEKIEVGVEGSLFESKSTPVKRKDKVPIVEQVVPPGTTRAFPLDHYSYIVASDAESNAEGRTLTVGFKVANILRSDETEIWSDPITVIIPKQSSSVPRGDCSESVAPHSWW